MRPLLFFWNRSNKQGQIFFLFTPQFKRLANALTLTWCGVREVFKRSYVLITKKKGKSNVLFGGFCLCDLGEEE